MIPTINRHGRLLGAAVVVLSLVACGGGGGTSSGTTLPVATSTGSTETSAASTTATTAASATTAGGESTSTPSTTPAEPVMPLTGLPITDPAAAARVALVVKIDAHPEARPQSGLNQADIVYEENVEGYTRFAAVFQTNMPDPVGPIRSGREQDVQLLGSLNKPIFAWSGGNPGVTAAINGSDFVVADVQTNARQAGRAYRSNDRGVPHNLYAYGSGLFTMQPDGATPPPQQFQYLAAGESASGDASAGVDVKMEGGLKVKWTYDAADNVYKRFQDGKAHNDAALGQVDATNVVVLVVDYIQSAIDTKSPIAQTLGNGEVFVFTGGKLVHGTWARDDRLKPFTLTADDGSTIKLTPGRTWVELARTDSTTPAGP